MLLEEPVEKRGDVSHSEQKSAIQGIHRCGVEHHQACHLRKSWQPGQFDIHMHLMNDVFSLFVGTARLRPMWLVMVRTVALQHVA